jgi:hypothetical protein
MLYVYGDESADESKQRVFAVAGLIGSAEMWAHIEASWLIRTNGTPFHSNDCDSDQGDYAGHPHADNKALYRDLTQMLAASGLGGWAFAIDMAAQRRVFPDAPDITFYKAFLEVLNAMTNCAINNGQTVKFTFDSRRESEHNAGELYRMFNEHPASRDHTFHEVSFVNSRTNPRIQMADLFAREAMKAYDNRIGPVQRPSRKSWMALYQTGRFHLDVIRDEWFQSLKEQLPQLQEKANMSGEKYALWLAENNLQHNTTNLFRYCEWSKQSGAHEALQTLVDPSEQTS